MQDLVAGQIDMMSQAFDAYLFLEDSAGNVLLEDDDSGGEADALGRRDVTLDERVATERDVQSIADVVDHLADPARRQAMIASEAKAIPGQKFCLT